MSEVSETAKKKSKKQDGESSDPVQVIREGAVAASIWKRQSPSGYAYYDFTLSRSWKSAASGKTGYSKSFFEGNRAELLRVIERASLWIINQNQPSSSAGSTAPVEAAA